MLTWLILLSISGILFGVVWGLSRSQKDGEGIWSSVLVGLSVALANMLSKCKGRSI